MPASPFFKGGCGQSPVAVDFFVQCKDTVGKASDGQILKRFSVNFHTAVDQVDLREQFCLGAHRAHGRAELRLAVVREQQVLQQQL